MENLQNLSEEEIKKGLEDGSLMKCSCGAIFYSEEGLDTVDGCVCPTCAENYEKCEGCGKYIHIDDVRVVDGDYYCEDCFDEDFISCEDCGTVVHRDSSDCYWIDDGEFYVCDSCYYDNYGSCADCGNTTHIDNLYWNEDDECYYCDCCYSNNQSVISSYHTHKNHCQPIFHTENGVQDNDDGYLFLGAEIEVDRGDDNRYTAECVINDMNNFVYCESDGSLDDGFEIITQPATLNFHKGIYNNYKKAFEFLIRQGFRSHNTSTCGLHIHFNRSFFGANGSEEQEMAITRLLYLTEKMWDDLSKFARRNLENCRWAKKYNKNAEDIVKEIKDNNYNNEIISHDRYMGVNLTNKSTIEFRIFKGTLKLNTYIASLQLVDLLVRIAKDSTISITDLQSYNFEKIMQIAIDKNYSEMVQYLRERQLLPQEDTTVVAETENTNSEEE